MSGAELMQARDDLALLTGRTASLETSLKDQDAMLQGARRAATDGGPLADVVLSQTYRDAAHGLLEQHRQDVDQARAKVAQLEQVEQAAQRLAEGRRAFEAMQRTAQAHDLEAQQAEAALSQSLETLALVADQHRRARLTIRATLQRLPADQRAAWLAQIDPALTEADFSPWSGLGLAESRFPLLVKVGANR